MILMVEWDTHCLFASPIILWSKYIHVFLLRGKVIVTVRLDMAIIM